jgi:hypothetical protein
MISPLFTAFALIAVGQAKVPPAPPENIPPPGIRYSVPELTRRLDRFSRDEN